MNPKHFEYAEASMELGEAYDEFIEKRKPDFTKNAGAASA